jgi:hypothetical protein
MNVQVQEAGLRGVGELVDTVHSIGHGVLRRCMMFC